VDYELSSRDSKAGTVRIERDAITAGLGLDGHGLPQLVWHVEGGGRRHRVVKGQGGLSNSNDHASLALCSHGLFGLVTEEASLLEQITGVEQEQSSVESGRIALQVGLVRAGKLGTHHVGRL